MYNKRIVCTLYKDYLNNNFYDRFSYDFFTNLLRFLCKCDIIVIINFNTIRKEHYNMQKRKTYVIMIISKTIKNHFF